MRALRIILVALAAAGLMTPTAAVASADDFVSDPAPRAELDRAPGWVTMAFQFEVDPSTAKMLVVSGAGVNVTAGTLIVEWTNVTTQLRDKLAKDTYTVHYRVSRPDGEPLGGSFQFAYGKGTWSAKDKTTWEGADKEPEVIKNADPNATTTATARPSRPSRTPVESPKASPTPTTTSPTPEPSASVAVEPPSVPPEAPAGSDPLPWVVGTVIVGAATAAGLWWSRGRRNQSV